MGISVVQKLSKNRQLRRTMRRLENDEACKSVGGSNYSPENLLNRKQPNNKKKRNRNKSRRKGKSKNKGRKNNKKLQKVIELQILATYFYLQGNERHFCYSAAIL